MTYPEVLANARTCIGQYCKACPVCNGVACKNQIPGPGAKGVGAACTEERIFIDDSVVKVVNFAMIDDFNAFLQVHRYQEMAC